LFANRYTAFLDACSLAGVLQRNLLLSLSEAEFYRIRWSMRVLDETQSAIEKMLIRKGVEDAAERALSARTSVEVAFEDAMVEGYEHNLPLVQNAPDLGDVHVISAAAKAQAAVIVTDNVKDFPHALLRSFNLEAKTTDAFLADAITLDEGRAVFAIRQMRERFKRPEISADTLLLRMEAVGLYETCNVLRPFAGSL
jgi:hypothetical protein